MVHLKDQTFVWYSNYHNTDTDCFSRWRRANAACPPDTVPQAILTIPCNNKKVNFDCQIVSFPLLDRGG